MKVPSKLKLFTRIAVGALLLTLPTLGISQEAKKTKIEYKTAKEIKENAKIQQSLKKSKQFSNAFQQIDGFSAHMSDCASTDPKKPKSKSACIKEFIEADANKDKFDYDTMQLIAKELDFNDPEQFTADKAKSYYILKEYLTKEIAKNLYGEEEKSGNIKKRNIVDQVKFIKLYRTQLSKNVLLEISQFCIENLPSQKAISDGNASAGTYDAGQKSIHDKQIAKTFETEKKTDDEGAHYRTCVGCIDIFCHKRTEADYKNKEKIIAATACKTLLGQKAYKAKEKEIRSNACALLPRLRQYRSAIATLDKVQNTIKSSKSEGKGYGAVDAGFKGLYSEKGEKEGEKSIEELTTLSSAQIIKDSGLGKEWDKQAKAFKEGCKSTEDMDTCEKLMNVQGQADLDELTDQFDLKTKLLGMKLTNDEENKALKDFLVSNKSMTEEEVEKILIDAESDGTIANIKTQAQEDLKRERDALKAKLNNQIKSNFANKELDNLKQLNYVLGDKKGRLQRLYHYNNVVTSYIERTIKKEGVEDKKFADTRAFEKEMNESAFESDSKYFQAFQKNADAAIKRIQSNHNDSNGSNDNRAPASEDSDSSATIDTGLLDMILGNEAIGN